ncbi:hypothetical protein ABIB37_000348 [Agrococcus sp. UYP10]|uniref:hypothetical protein n=1 Tax=Agrococcus sp. UYP10 TaxID=1756355 RepID=UPI0033933810
MTRGGCHDTAPRPPRLLFPASVAIVIVSAVLLMWLADRFGVVHRQTRNTSIGVFVLVPSAHDIGYREHPCDILRSRERNTQEALSAH